MALALVSLRPVRPSYELKIGRATLRFYHDDCLTVLPALDARTIGVIVTSPPYNLGIRYRSYKDDLPRTEYLNWTDRWIREAARVMDARGSLFLNVGAKPTDPWIALEVAQVARRHFKLQNTIHWVKSIAIDQASAGAAAGLDRDMAVGHYKPINSDRFVNDCHEFIFHFSPAGRTPAGPAGRRRALPGPVEHQALGQGRRRQAVPRQHLVHPVRDDPEPRPGPSAPRVLPAEGPRAVRDAARTRAGRRGP